MISLLFVLFVLSQLGIFLIGLAIFSFAMKPMAQSIGNLWCIVILLITMALHIVGLFAVAAVFDKVKQLQGNGGRSETSKGGLIVYAVCLVITVASLILMRRAF